MSQAQQGKATNLFASSSNSALFVCNGCGYHSQQRYLYERHVKRCVAHATGETFDVSRFKERMPQLVHRNYRCKQCNFTTTKSKLFLAHRRAVHGDVIKIYPCDICEYASKYKSKLLRHRNLKHKDAGEYSDENAGYMSEETAEDLLLNASNHLHIAVGAHNGDKGARSSTLTIALDGTLGDRVLKSSDRDEAFRVHVKEEPQEGDNSSQDDEENSQPENKDGSTSLDLEQDLQQRKGQGDNAFTFISESRDTEGKPVSQCTLCNYSNAHKWKVANHVRSFHMRRKLIKCSDCDFVTGRKIELCVHKAKQHATKVYSCSECSYCTISRTNFDRHSHNHVGGGPVKCTYCSYSSTGEAAVIRHMQEYHPKQQTTPPPPSFPAQKSQPLPAPRAVLPSNIFTPNVRKTYPTHNVDGVNVFDFSSRFKSKPMRIETGVSKLAANRTPSTSGNNSSNMMLLPKKPEGKTGNEVDCPVCGITFRTEARLRIHMVSHSNEATHHCPLCSLKYKRTSDLNRHMKKKHGSKLRDFFYMGSQEQPLNLSVRPENLPAAGLYSPVASATTSASASAATENDQPLDLSMKPKAQVLQVPSVSSKPFRGPYSPEELKCSLCSYLAKWPSDLKRHALVHSMEKRYKCEQCQRRYKYQFDLNMHMRRTHHVMTGRPRVSNVIPRTASPPLTKGMTLPTRLATPPATESMSSPNPVIRVPSEFQSSPPHQDDSGGSSPLASLRPLLPSPSPPLDPIQVNIPMEVVFAPSSVHDMENTLPASMQRVVEPTTSSTPSRPEEKLTLGPTVEQAVSPSRLGTPEKPPESRTGGLGLPRPKLPMSSPVEQAISGVEHKAPRVLKMKAMKPQRPSSLNPARKFKCQYCPYLGLYQSEVDRHTRLHTGEKPYKCIYCVYRSAWKGDMKRHIIKHHAPEIALATSLESIIDVCCSAESQEHETTVGNAEEVETKAEEVDDEKAQFDSDDDDDKEKNNDSEEIFPGDQAQTPTDKTARDLDYNGNKQIHINAMETKEHDDGHRETADRTSEIDESSSESWDVVLEEVKDPGKYVQRFRCLVCGKRSNWRWEMKEHIKEDHQSSVQMANASYEVLSEEDEVSDDDDDKAATEAESGELDVEAEDKQTKEKHVEKEVKGEDIMEEANKEENAAKKPEENNNDEACPLTESVSGKKKYRPYKCSACPRRSNWRWDIMKHIRRIHGSAKMITLSEEVARATFSESVMKRPRGQGLKSVTKPEHSIMDSTVASEKAKLGGGTTKESSGKTEDSSAKKVNGEENDSNVPLKRKIVEAKDDKEDTQPVVTTQSPRKKQLSPGAFIPESFPKSPMKKAKVETIKCKGSKKTSNNNNSGMKTRQSIPGTEQVDEGKRDCVNGKPVLRSLKRYKCYYCPYRSNYRSDIGRHGKRLHRKQQLKVVILDEEEAASTLQDYRQKYAKKKFVLATNADEGSNPCKSKTSVISQQPKNASRPVQEVWMSESARVTESSNIRRILLGESSFPSAAKSRHPCAAATVRDREVAGILFDQSNVMTNDLQTNGSICQTTDDGATQLHKNCENTLPNCV